MLIFFPRPAGLSGAVITPTILKLLSTNYFYKPYKVLKESGFDFRQFDENSFSFIQNIKNEIKQLGNVAIEKRYSLPKLN